VRSTFLSSSSEVVQLTDVEKIEITADEPFPWQVDGDYLGEQLQLAVTYLPDCLTLIIP
jgi:diacylglycerol kinase family enzyme